MSKRWMTVAVAVLGLTAVGRAQRCPEWSDLGTGTDDLVSALCVHDDGSGAALFAGGSFTTAGGAGASGIARWDGTSWSALGAGVSGGTVLALTTYDDGGGPTLIAGGSFTHAGGQPFEHLARWDGTAWSALLFQPMDDVLALAIYDDGGGGNLYAGGLFFGFNGMRVPLLGIARWNGTIWWPLTTGVGDFTLHEVHALAVFDDGTGEALYVGGDFLTAGGSPASRIARWDGTGWSALGSGMDDVVQALAVFDDGFGPALYAGGAFTTAGGVAAARIARWDGTGWSALGTGLDGAVRALATFDDGRAPALYAGGTFTTAGGVAASRIARWDGRSWSALSSGLNASVLALASFDDGTEPGLYAGGTFTEPPGDRVARWSDPCAPEGFCFGTDADCPCANGGDPGSGCDIQQGTGGVRLDVLAQETSPLNRATLRGSGYPATSSPAAIAIRASGLDPGAPVVFGDGLRCVGIPVVRLGATIASGGVSLHTFGHGAMAGDGTFTYQLWFRNAPAMFCDPTAAFNLSNGRALVWPKIE